MTGLRVWASRIRAFFRKGPLDADFDQELESHLELAVDDFVAQGFSLEESRRRARLELGSLDAAREEHRDTRGLPQLDMLLQDLRFTRRSLWRDKGFAVISILILGLGIGATTAVFSVVNAVLLQPLPFSEPERLAWLSYAPKEEASAGLSAVSPRVAIFEQWQERSHSFEALSSYNAFFGFGSYKLTSGPEPARLAGVRVARDFFDLLGVQPLLGRPFTEQEAAVEGPPAVILSHHLWQRQFGGDPDIVGQAVDLSDRQVTVVGVMPETMDFGAVFSPGTKVDLFIPLRYDEVRNWGNTLAVVGRLKPGVTVAEAQAEMETVTALLVEEELRLAGHIDARVVSLADHVHGSTRRSLVVLLICVAAVLLIACANIANLQLARAASRSKELAIRSALGAGRPRVLRQLLTESLVLSSLGAACGLAVAYGLTQGISRLQAVSLPLLSRVQLDGRALLVTMVITLTAGLIFGLTPALALARLRSRGGLRSALADGGRGASAGGWQGRVRSGLVVAETALACVLLVGAGLLARSFVQVLQVDLGFEPEQALTVTVDTDTGIPSLEERTARVERLVGAVETLPGVRSASVTDALPLDRNRTWGIAPRGRGEEVGDYVSTFVIRSGAGYLRTLGIPLQGGRDFDRSEAADSRPVVVINETLAAKLFPGEDALGRLVNVGGDDRTVVGVAANVRHKGVESGTGHETYIPYVQNGASALELVVRYQGEPAAMLRQVRTALREADPELPLADLRPLSWLVDRAVSPRRFFLTLLGGFALFALLLASLGIYGVISYSVGQRSGEIGIRMALGASRNQVRLRVLKETLALAGLGIVLGAAGAVLLGRAMASLLYSVEAMDPLTFAAMLGLAVAAALLAGLLPSLRAGHVDPLSVLRAS